MKETGLIISAPLIPKVLDGTKTVTRRLWGLKEINQSPDNWGEPYQIIAKPHIWTFRNKSTGQLITIKCPYGGPGDKLYIKETWALTGAYAVDPCLCYKADGKQIPISFELLRDKRTGGFRPGVFSMREGWRSPRFMPKWAARIWLEIVSVRPERLQEITEKDAVAEGIKPAEHAFYMIAGGDVEVETSPIEQFAELWDSLNAKRGYSWSLNPWVWRIEFKVVSFPMSRDGMPKER